MFTINFDTIPYKRQRSRSRNPPDQLNQPPPLPIIINQRQNNNQQRNRNTWRKVREQPRVQAVKQLQQISHDQNTSKHMVHSHFMVQTSSAWRESTLTSR